MSRIWRWLQALFDHGSSAAVPEPSPVPPEADDESTRIAQRTRFQPWLDSLARRKDAAAVRAVALVHQHGADPDQLVVALIGVLGQAENKTQRAMIDIILSADPSVQTVSRLLLGKDLESAHAAAWVLGRIRPGSAAAVPTLIPLLDTERSSHSAGVVIDALARIGEKAVPGLAAALTSPETRQNALSAIEKIGPGAVAAVPALEALALASAAREALRIPRILEKLGAASLPTLLRILEHAPASALHADVAAVLANGGAPDPDVLGALRKVLESDGPASDSAGQALAKLAPDSPGALRWMLARLDHGDPQVVVPLARLGESIVPSLLRVFNSGSPAAVSVAVRVSERMAQQARETLPALEAIVRSRKGRAREDAAKAIIAVDGGGRPLERILTAIAPLKLETQEKLLSALALNRRVQPGALLDLLAGEREDIGMLAGRWLVAVGERAIPYLLDFIGPNNPHSYQAQSVVWDILASLGRVVVPTRPFPPPGEPEPQFMELNIRQLDLDALFQASKEAPYTVDFIHAALSNRRNIEYLTGPPRVDFQATARLIDARRRLLSEIEAKLDSKGIPYPGFDELAFPGSPVEIRLEAPAPAAASESSDQAAPEAPAEVPRYTDVELFHGHIFNPRLTQSSPAVAEDTPLRPGAQYTLTVAIRATRKGIGADQEPARAVRNPRGEREDIEVYVVVTPLTKAVTVGEPFKKLKWPFGADSDVAVFHLSALEAAQGDLEIRMYDKSLDLLDIVMVTVVVAPETDNNAPPRRVYWPDRRSALTSAQPNLTQRLASVHVREVNNGYEFEFTLRDPAGELLRIPILCQIKTGDLEALLRKVRNFWTKLVITNYSDKLSVTQATFAHYLGELRDLGVEAWMTLFGARFADQKGSSEIMAEFLAQTGIPDGAIIQITQNDNGTGFVFPWALLYPRTKVEAVDPYSFWGAKFRIEQVTRGDQVVDSPCEQPIKMLFALDQSFDRSAAHEQQIAAFAAAAKTKVAITGPICTQQELFAGLMEIPPAHFVYFFCHGFTAGTNPLMRADAVQTLRKSIEAIKVGTPERDALETLLRLSSQMDDYSWMYIGGAQVKEVALKQQDFFEERRPIVFLNMCQSADLLPSLSTGFVRVFLDHNAAAVIGTESPMTAVFASAFAEKILEALFQGDDVGMALWKARRHFLQPHIRNPLGLAYTLYGRTVAKLGASNPSPQVNPDQLLTP